jgi:hypothetical protein
MENHTIPFLHRRQWRTIAEGHYAFMQDETTLATMEIARASTERKAAVTIDKEHYTIEKVGFWKNRIEISDRSGKVIATCATEKWYANTMTLDYKGHNYTLRVRNNPLAEWVIQAHNSDLLAYGLMIHEGNAAIKLTAAPTHHDLLLDCLLWYLFVPIATENVDDGFLLLVV